MSEYLIKVNTTIYNYQNSIIIMKRLYKFLMFLLSLLVGGVNLSASASAATAEAADDGKIQIVSPPKAYYITNKNAGLNLSVDSSKEEKRVTLQTGATVFLTAVTKKDGSGGGYIISSSDDSGEFVCLQGDNNWSLSTTTDIDDAYILDMKLTKGVYYFKGSNGCLGTDEIKTNSTVYADKPIPTFDDDNNVVTDIKNAVWTISKVSNPRLLPAMYFKWNGLDANAQVVANNPACEHNIDDGKPGVTIYGLTTIDPNSYADLTGYRTLELIVKDGTPRLLFNSIADAVDKRLNVYVRSDDPYIIGQSETTDGTKWVIDLEKIYKEYGYVHLNAIKGYDWQTEATVTSAKLEQYADDTQLDLTINVWRKAGLGNNAADGNNSQSVSVDFKDVQSFLGVNAVTENMLKMVDENGGFVGMGSYDGWFGADGNPKEWDSGPVICAKFFEAVKSQTNSIGVFHIYNYPSTGNEGDVYSAKWAITANNKIVIYTINVHFINFAADKVSDQIGNGVAEDATNLWINRSTDDAIKVYMGGWKYQAGSKLASYYTKPAPNYTLHTVDNEGKVKKQTDTWQDSGPEKSPNDIVDIQQATIDGYLYGSFGKDNARSEFLWENGINPPFEYALAKRGSINGKGNPFTIPCFGTFLKFEPERDGKVIAYVLQNGVLDMSTAKDLDTGHEIYGLTNNIGWRPVYIVDEAGNRLPENTAEAGKMPNGVMAETNQRVYVGMDHSQSVIDKDDKTNSQPFVYWVSQYFETGKGKDHQNLKDYWLASGEKQEIMPPSKTGDGWIAVSKAYVKYTFDVKAGKSYYIFSNDTKIGYCGFEFIPTNEPKDDITIPDNGDYASEAEWKSQVDEFAGKSYKSVTISRTLQPGWNAICLPFSVTEDKMRELFGTTKNGVKQETYELVIYNGAEPIHDGNYLKAHFFRHAYQDIIAWYPYMLYIPKDADIWGGNPPTTPVETTLTFNNVTFDEYEDINVSSSEEYMPSGSGFENYSTETDYVFKGHHYKHNVPAASYLVTPQGIQYYKNSVTMNAFRSYLAPNEQRAPSEIKILSATNFSDVLDDEHWNDATVINALAEEMGLFSQPSDVYSVSGLLMRKDATSLVGLPKGIYIVNGKKYFVK